MSPARRLAAIGAAAVCWLAAPADTPAAPQAAEAIERLRFEAAELEKAGDPAGAMQKYRLLSEQFPEAPAAADALLRLAAGNLELGEDAAAREALETLIRDHPRAPQAAGGYALLGQLQADRAADAAALDEARVTLDNAVILFPRSAYPAQPWRAEGAVRGARVALLQGREAQAAEALIDVIDLEPRSPWAAAARVELAGLLVEQDEWSSAAGLLQEVVDGAAAQELAAAARRGLGLIHRLGLRPAAETPRWQSGRVVSAAPERPTAVAARDDGQVAVTGAKGPTVVLDEAGQPAARYSHEEGRRSTWLGDQLAVVTEESAATFPERRNLRFASPPGVKKPTVRPLVAVEAARFGRWAVLAAKPPRVLLYEPERRLHQTLVEGRGREPVDLARDRRGRLLVLDGKERSVTRFATGEDSGERLVTGGWDSAEALAVDAAGNIYVLDRGRRTIEVFDRGGQRLAGLGPSLPGGLELERPRDLTVDPAGRIWIADARTGLVVLE